MESVNNNNNIDVRRRRNVRRTKFKADPGLVSSIKGRLARYHAEAKLSYGHEPTYSEAKAWSEDPANAAKCQALRDDLNTLPKGLHKRLLNVQILRNVDSSVASDEHDRFIRALDFGGFIMPALRGLARFAPKLLSYGKNLIGRGASNLGQRAAVEVRKGLLQTAKDVIRKVATNQTARNLAIGTVGGMLGEKLVRSQTESGNNDEDDDADQIYNPSATNAYEGRQFSTMIKRQLGHDHNGDNSSYSINSVNAGYACCSILAPKYSELRPGEYGSPFSLSKIVNTYSFPTSPTGGTWPGSLQVIVYPLNVFNNASGQNAAYISYSNDITYNPATGSQTPAKGLVVGPMNSLVSNVTKFSVIACNTKIFFTASELNNSGTVQVAYWTGQPNSTFYPQSTTVTVTQSEQTNWPYYTETNLTGKSIDVGDLPELDLPTNYYYANPVDSGGDSNFDYTDFGYVITITGAQPATQVMRFDVTTIMAIVPSSATLPLCPTRMAPPGQATVSFLLSLYKICPSLLMADTEKKAALCNFIQNSGLTDHDTLLNAVLESGILPAC